MNIGMKPVKVGFYDELLVELDNDPEVQRLGRSKVLRHLVASYLRDRRRAMLDDQYAVGYGGAARVSEELEGWDEEGAWPAE
jgi:metal-responsive CopG/Arc/MetJ family transcriptional regulator